MSAILKKIDYLEDLVLEDTRHPIVMYFSKSESDNELYPFRTTLEKQYCTNEELTNGILDVEVENVLFDANKQVGQKFDINLYKFKVSELTDGLFVALTPCYSDWKIYYYKRASFMSREDMYLTLKYRICLEGLMGDIFGITSYGKEKRIDQTLIFEDSYDYIISPEQSLRYRVLGEHPWVNRLKEKIKENDRIYSIRYKDKIKIKTIF